MQVYAGRRPKQKPQQQDQPEPQHVQHTQSDQPLPVDFVAVTHPYWSNEPLIGEVLEVTEDVKIQWWMGTYSSKWKPEKIREGRNMVLHTERLQKNQILLTFKWTKKDKMTLPAKVKGELKSLYANLK